MTIKLPDIKGCRGVSFLQLVNQHLLDNLVRLDLSVSIGYLADAYALDRLRHLGTAKRKVFDFLNFRRNSGCVLNASGRHTCGIILVNGSDGVGVLGFYNLLDKRIDVNLNIGVPLL